MCPRKSGRTCTLYICAIQLVGCVYMKPSFFAMGGREPSSQMEPCNKCSYFGGFWRLGLLTIPPDALSPS